ncbi:MAG: hypothetical protein ABGY42_02490, partial [bacterium]
MRFANTILRETPFAPLLVAALLVLGIGCGDGSNPYMPHPTPTPEPGPTAVPTPIPTGEPTPEPTAEPEACADGVEYESTWAGIYDQVIVAHDCANDACHGSGAAGGLDLRADVAWENIHEMPATGSAFDLIEPGDNDGSYLWL